MAAEQAALSHAQLLVWLCPTHWYGLPPMLKLWQDEVLGFGWAYGPGGRALHHKALWLVASTGGPAESYRPAGRHGHAFDDFLPPYRQTAALAGISKSTSGTEKLLDRQEYFGIYSRGEAPGEPVKTEAA